MIKGLASSLPLQKQESSQASDEARLKAVTEEFEAIFLEIVLKNTRAAAQDLSGPGKSYARDVFEGWQDQAFARSIVGGGGVGLAVSLYRQLASQGTRSK